MNSSQFCEKINHEIRIHGTHKMITMHNFREKLKEKKPLIGILQTLDSPEVTEILSAAGFDWLFIDLEHSPMDILAAQRILEAAGNQCPCIIRSPSHDEAWIKKILDIGAAGIIVPRVNTAEEASSIVRFCKYPPVGCRSVGFSRAQGFGFHFNDYVENANDRVAVILQIEDIKGVKNVESIAGIPGIDALFIGPYDLSGSMGKPGKVKDNDVLDNIEHVRNVSLNSGLAAGIFTSFSEEVPSLKERNFTLIAAGVDTGILGQAAQQAVKIMKSTS